jgi:hypothetical protein
VCNLHLNTTKICQFRSLDKNSSAVPATLCLQIIGAILLFNRHMRHVAQGVMRGRDFSNS